LKYFLFLIDLKSRQNQGFIPFKRIKILFNCVIEKYSGNFSEKYRVLCFEIGA
jgi:hypothetical protein